MIPEVCVTLHCGYWKASGYKHGKQTASKYEKKNEENFNNQHRKLCISSQQTVHKKTWPQNIFWKANNNVEFGGCIIATDDHKTTLFSDYFLYNTVIFHLKHEPPILNEYKFTLGQINTSVWLGLDRTWDGGTVAMTDRYFKVWKLLYCI